MAIMIPIDVAQALVIGALNLPSETDRNRQNCHGNSLIKPENHCRRMKCSSSLHVERACGSKPSELQQ
jgi:hypothetical protein